MLRASGRLLRARGLVLGPQTSPAFKQRLHDPCPLNTHYTQSTSNSFKDKQMQNEVEE